MDNKWILIIQGWEIVKNVVEKEAKMWSNVNNVMGKVWLCKCFKWELECINKYKKSVINVKVKVKL